MTCGDGKHVRGMQMLYGFGKCEKNRHDARIAMVRQ